MINSILSILAGLFQGIGGWMSSYANKENTKARVENDITKRKDEFNQAITSGDIDEERKRLS